jgi:hypothetical protein
MTVDWPVSFAKALVRPARRSAPKELFATKPRRLKKGASASERFSKSDGTTDEVLDASAIIPLLMTEATSKTPQTVAEKDP